MDRSSAGDVVDESAWWGTTYGEHTMAAMTVSRRDFLGAAAGLGAVHVTGCLASSDAAAVQTAFFALQDWTEIVVGDALSVDSPVEVGRMGHGWDPGADIVPRIASGEVFIYLGTPEFQWALDVADELNEDHPDVRLIDGMDAIASEELLAFETAHDADREADDESHFDPATVTVGEFDLMVGGETVAWWHDEHWHGGVPDVPLDESITIDLHVEDDRGRVPPLGSDALFQFGARLADEAPTDVIDIGSEGDVVTVTGREIGQTLLVFELRAGDDVVFDTAADPVTMTVGDPEDVDIDAFYDPHVWVDPIIVQDIVDHLAAELGSVFPEDAAGLQERADDYRDRLAAVDRQFQTMIEDAEITVGVLAGHSSFQYLERRYDFELVTPVGISPDAAESIQDVIELADVIDEYGIETVLYDPFEATDPDEDVPQAVEVLLENTAATGAAPLTPAEGTTATWQERGYGWVEQMEEINLPSLRAAFRADR